MNRLLNLSLLIVMAVSQLNCVAQAPEGKDQRQIQKTVETFVKGGDKQDVEMLEGVLHDSYRIVWNDQNEGVVKIVDRSTYLTLIGNKTFGGDTRKVQIEQIEMQGELNATVKVFLDGEKADFYTFLSLVKDNGEWKLVQDLVLMKA